MNKYTEQAKAVFDAVEKMKTAEPKAKIMSLLKREYKKAGFKLKVNQYFGDGQTNKWQVIVMMDFAPIPVWSFDIVQG